MFSRACRGAVALISGLAATLFANGLLGQGPPEPCTFAYTGPLALQPDILATLRADLRGLIPPVSVRWQFEDGTTAEGTLTTKLFDSSFLGKLPVTRWTVTSGGCQGFPKVPSTLTFAAAVLISNQGAGAQGFCPATVSSALTTSVVGQPISFRAVFPGACTPGANYWVFPNPEAPGGADVFQTPTPFVTYAYSVPATLSYQYLSGAQNGNFISTAVGFIDVKGACPPRPVTLQVPSSADAGSPFALTWNLAGADKFQAQITSDSAFANLVHDAQTCCLTHSAAFIIDKPGTYYARVVASSEGCSTTAVSNTVSLAVQPAPARVILSQATSGMVQLVGQGGASDNFVLTNVGGVPAPVTLSTSGSFFVPSASSLTLAPGENRTVSLTGTAQPAGAYQGSVLVSGLGVPAGGLSVPVALAAFPPPSGSVAAEAQDKRLDLSGLVGTNPMGNVSFRNTGTATLTGVLKSDHPWLVPQSAPVSIASGATATATFQVDRSRRTLGSAAPGTDTTTLRLFFPTGSALSAASAQPRNGSGGGVSKVSVNDTVVPASTPVGSIPPIPGGQVALFIPGVGNVQGSVGLFLSDAFLSNTSGSEPISDLTIYYNPSSVVVGTSSVSTRRVAPRQEVTKYSTSFALAPGQSVALTDLVRTIFGRLGETGSLQMRTKDWDKLAVTGSVFNVSNPRGTYGTAIPLARSDRGVSGGEQLTLVDIREGNGFHTNLYLQEMIGQPVAARIDFYDAKGVRLASRTQKLEPFGMVQMLSVVPAGTVTATVTNVASQTFESLVARSSLFAYATPVDEATGDSWAVVDWVKLRGAEQGQSPLVPVAGLAQGANNTFFHTDLALHNGSASESVGDLFYTDASATLQRPITVAPGETRTLADVVAGLFGATGNTVGYVQYVPRTGSLTITSRTYTTVAGQKGTYGTAAPTADVSDGLPTGRSRRFFGLEDASLSTIVSGAPATYRSNVGLINTSPFGSSTIRLTLLDATGSRLGSRQLTLAPRQGLLLGRIGAAVLGDSRDADYGDLHNVQLFVEVIGGAGTTLPYVSSIDNGTGDSILRTD